MANLTNIPAPAQPVVLPRSMAATGCVHVSSQTATSTATTRDSLVVSLNIARRNLKAGRITNPTLRVAAA
jgi:hypothetical protein